MDGTALLRVKQRIVELLAGQVANVAYQSPSDTQDVYGVDGSGVTIWWDDQATANVDVKVIAGADATWFDETVDLTLNIQALGTTSDHDQANRDAQAVEVLGTLLALIATDPTLGLTTDSMIQTFHVLPRGWTCTTGMIGPSTRGTVFSVMLETTARLTLELQ